MTRNDFLNALYHSLASIPDEERLMLVRSYDSYFGDELGRGRTEAEICRELGHPEELAVRILDARYAPPPEMPQEPPAPQTPPPVSRAPQAGGSPGRLIGMTPVVLLLNLILLPIGIGLWSALLSFGAAALAALFAPAAVLLDWLFNREFFPATLFASIAVTGAGILMMCVFTLICKGAARATWAYAKWNLRIWRGW